MREWEVKLMTTEKGDEADFVSKQGRMRSASSTSTISELANVFVMRCGDVAISQVLSVKR